MTEQSLFLQALELDADKRDDFLNNVCGDDHGLRKRLERLLAATEDNPDFLNQSPLPRLLSPASAPSENKHVTTSSSPRKSDGPDLGFLTPSDDPNLLGQLGRFEVLSVLGHGGMGIVFKARDPELDRIVAIKVLFEQKIPPDMLAVARQRFIREAKAMATFRSDFVIQIHDVLNKHEPPFFVMEYVHGRTLKDKIQTEGPIDIEELMRIGIEIASGLAAAHQSPNKLIHRDIKPENILLVNGIERVKIVDFGLAKEIATEEADITGGMILGTVMYMSPEQANPNPEKPIDPRTDLYSLGVTLHHMATGVPPFRGRSVTDVLQKVLTKPLPPLGENRPEFPPGLIEIIRQLTEKPRTDRIQTAAEVVRQLERELTRWQEPDSVDVDEQTFITTPDRVRTATDSEDSPDSDKQSDQREPAKKPAVRIRRGYLIAASIVLAIGLLVIGGIFWWSQPAANERIDANELRVSSLRSLERQQMIAHEL